jgi:hypothetical protein
VDIKLNKLGMYGKGFYLSDDFEIACEYADIDNPAYVQAHILVKNPKIFEKSIDAGLFFRSKGIPVNDDQKKTELFKSLGYSLPTVEIGIYYLGFRGETPAWGLRPHTPKTTNF